MSRKAEQLRARARSIRQSARYAQGACYHREMQEAQQLEAEASRIERKEKQQAEYRKKTLAKIHIAKKDLGLNDDTYRQMLKEITGKSSCGNMNKTELNQALYHIKKKGWKVNKRKTYPGRPNNTDRSPQLKKIEDLLAEAKRPWEYVRTMAESMYHKKRLEFCDSQELSGIITALIKDAKRHGRRTE